MTIFVMIIEEVKVEEYDEIVRIMKMEKIKLIMVIGGMLWGYWWLRGNEHEGDSDDYCAGEDDECECDEDKMKMWTLKQLCLLSNS